MRLDVTVSSLRVFDTIASGVDGGIQYWGKVLSFWVPGRGALSVAAAPHAADLHLVCEVLELETQARIALHGKWRGALRLMAEHYPHKFAELLTGRADRTTGDVLIQLAAFGEVRYG
jgi:hypothetical protein